MAPAVIYLSVDGRIDRVAMPRESSYLDDIKSLFPSDLQACAMDNACFDGPAAMQHIALRRADPSIPPAIIEQGVELP